jgi:hypothetical protein
MFEFVIRRGMVRGLFVDRLHTRRAREPPVRGIAGTRQRPDVSSFA